MAKGESGGVFRNSQRMIFGGYLEKGKTIIGEYYSLLLDCLKTELHKKHPRLAHKKRHHDSSYLNGGGLKNIGITVPCRSTSSLFSKFGSVRLLFVPRNEEMAGGKKSLFKRGDACRNDWVFYTYGQMVIFGRDRQTRAALNKG